MDPGASGYSVQPFITQQHTVNSGLRFQVSPSTLSLHASDLEDIGKIRSEENAQRHDQTLHSVIDQLQFLVAHLSPQEPRAQQMQRAPVNGDRVALRNVQICEIGSKKEIVRLNGRAQQ